jgi:hypothetical protein
MLRRSQVATTRIYDLNHVTNLALSASPTTRYVPPTVGKIRVRTTEGFSCSEDSGLFKPISNSQVHTILHWLYAPFNGGSSQAAIKLHIATADFCRVTYAVCFSPCSADKCSSAQRTRPTR